MSVWAISEEFADDDEKLKGEALAKVLTLRPLG